MDRIKQIIKEGYQSPKSTSSIESFDSTGSDDSIKSNDSVSSRENIENDPKKKIIYKKCENILEHDMYFSEFSTKHKNKIKDNLSLYLNRKEIYMDIDEYKNNEQFYGKCNPLNSLCFSLILNSDLGMV